MNLFVCWTYCCCTMKLDGVCGQKRKDYDPHSHSRHIILFCPVRHDQIVQYGTVVVLKNQTKHFPLRWKTRTWSLLIASICRHLSVEIISRSGTFNSSREESLSRRILLFVQEDCDRKKMEFF